jgi:hypothetical protein
MPPFLQGLLDELVHRAVPALLDRPALLESPEMMGSLGNRFASIRTPIIKIAFKCFPSFRDCPGHLGLRDLQVQVER